MTWSPEKLKEETRYLLFNAADDIQLYGWKNEGADFDEDDPYGMYPRCVWIALVRAVEANGIEAAADDRYYDKSLVLNTAENAVVKAAGLENISEVFDLNDRQDLEEGRGWAINLLEKAAEQLDIAPVLLDVPKDSVLTFPMDSGNTPNAKSRVKSFLRKLHLVK